MKDRSDDSSHHERTLLPRSYISLQIKKKKKKKEEEKEEDEEDDEKQYSSQLDKCYNYKCSKFVEVSAVQS